MTQRQAVACAFLGFLFWVCVDTTVKWCGQDRAPPMFILAVMGVVGILCLLIPAVARGTVARLRPRHWGKQSAVALTFFAAHYATVIAVNHLPLTLFYILVFTAPLLIAVLSVFVGHEKFSGVKCACLVTGFVGVCIAVGFEKPGAFDVVGCVAIAVSVLSFAVGTVFMRSLSTSDTVESTQLVAALPLVLIGGIGVWAQGFVPEVFVFLVIVAASAVNMLGNVFYNTAVHHTASSNVAQMHYTQLISGALFAYLIWHEVPGVNLLLGAVLIIGAGIVVASRAKTA